MPSLIRQLAGVLDELGLAEERISFRMSGCPNGCSRPYLGDVGFVGTTLGKYDVMLGGDFEGTRLNRVYAPNVPFAEIPTLPRPTFEAFRSDRRPAEGFGDWVERTGFESARALCDERDGVMRVLAPAEVRAGAEPEGGAPLGVRDVPSVTIVSSFQATSAVLIDMAARITQDVTVVTRHRSTAAGDPRHYR